MYRVYGRTSILNYSIDTITSDPEKALESFEKMCEKHDKVVLHVNDQLFLEKDSSSFNVKPLTNP